MKTLQLPALLASVAASLVALFATPAWADRVPLRAPFAQQVPLAPFALQTVSARGPAHPAPRHLLPTIEARLDQQARRIAQGRARGALTPREVQRLQAEQRHIRQSLAGAKADGVVTPRERAQLQQMLAAASTHIQRSLHDRQRWTGRSGHGPGGAGVW